MREWLPFIVVGVTSGSVYALAAMGLVLTFRTSAILNFGHGAQAAVAAYLMFEFRDRMGLPWPLAFSLALLLGGVVAGLVLERIGRGLATAPDAARVGATVGLLVGVQGVLYAVFGTGSLSMEYFLPTKLVSLPGVNVRVEQLLVTAFVLATLIVLYVFLSRTRLGAAIQAVVDDPVLLSTQGTDPVAVRRAAWVVGSSFAAVSGMLLAPTIGLHAGILSLLVFYAFGAAAVGRFDSLPLTYLGGLLIGVGASLLTKMISGQGAVAALPTTLPFLVLFAALLLTHRSRLVTRGTQVVRRPLPPIRFPRRTQMGLSAASVALLALIPALVGSRVSTYSTALGFVILIGALNLLVRTSAQISLCQMTFAAAGAVMFARAVDAGVPWPLAVLAGGFMAVPVGALVAIPAIRLSGIYLAVATFGFGLVIQNLVFPARWMFSTEVRPLAAPRPEVWLFDAHTDTGYFYVMLAVAGLCCAAMVAILRSRFGRLLQGLQEAPGALDAHGANTNVTRLWAFCVSAFFTGIAGAVLAPIVGSVSAPPYDFSISLLLVAVTFIAGRQPVLGPVIAAGLYVVVPVYITSATALQYVPVAFGVGAVITAIVGGVPILERVAASKRTKERAARRFRPAGARRHEATPVPAALLEVTS